MADITMCVGEKNGVMCKLAETCYRVNAKADPYRQSWFMATPFEVEGNLHKCEFRIEVKHGV